MSSNHGNHNTKQPSGSPRRTSSITSNATTVPGTPQHTTSKRPSLARHGTSFIMPDSDRIRYSNKESCKVNMGLGHRSWHDQDVESEAPTGPWCTNKPAVDIDFSHFLAPIVAPESKPSTQVLVRRLLHPPPHAFIYRNLSMQWVIGAVGREHIEFRGADERYVLAGDSVLRHFGAALGLPALYMEWLCGDDANMSATEQGIHLTPEYFEKIDTV